MKGEGAALALGRTEGRAAETWVSLVQGEEVGRAGPLVPEGGAVAMLRRSPYFLGAQEVKLPTSALRGLTPPWLL